VHVRCAIYTRKSTDEGLDQEFNSLDAQREAAEAYIESQKHEGWMCLPERYDDGGFSGGTMDRPALKRLVSDIEEGKVDCVVVYKVDRLSRSLLDFIQIMAVLDQQDVSFVSVTQQFNTTTSMGRLTLNILLSFAQFEREIIAERTRDKMSAARRKGKWVGGMPVLGYDVAPGGGRLIVNEDEANRVRAIYELYLERRSLVETVRELHRRNWNSKRWTTKKGCERGGRPFNKSNLFNLLANVIYLGKVNHKGTIYPGEHEAIVDDGVWRRVQECLRRNGRTGGRNIRNKHGALLKGILYCMPCGTAMTHTYSAKNNKRYRYYVCTRAQKEGWNACPTKSLPAGEIESFVVERIRCIGKDSVLISEVIKQAHAQHGKRIKELKHDQRMIEKKLAGYNAEMRRLVGSSDINKGDESRRTTRLAELADRVRTSGQRIIDIRDEITGLNQKKVDKQELKAALSLFDPVWESLAPREKVRVIRLLVERVGYNGEEGKVAVTFRPSGIKALAREANLCEREESA
jgi:site-specific DNA recombinase